MTLALNNLPAIQFVNADVNQTVQNIITTYEAICGRKLYPADPLRLFLLSIAQIIVQQRAIINQTAKQNLLCYATGEYLDHLGAMVETERLDAAPALTTVRFHLSVPLSEAVLIPAGTRVSPGNELFFATTKVGEIKPGALHIDLICSCLTPGVRAMLSG